MFLEVIFQSREVISQSWKIVFQDSFIVFQDSSHPFNLSKSGILYQFLDVPGFTQAGFPGLSGYSGPAVSNKLNLA